MTKKRKRKPKTKPPAVVADLFDVPDELVSAPETPASSPTVERASIAREGAERPPEPPREGMALVESRTRHLARLRARDTLAVREVLGFPAVHVAELPRAFTLRCELDGVPFVFTSSRASYTEARELGLPVFVMRELVAIAHAAQNDRVPAYVFDEMLERKRDSPSFVVGPAFAFGGMTLDSAEPIACTVGDAFERMGVELVAVEVSP